MLGLELAMVTPWWSDQTAGIIGGAIGSALGIFGGVTGTMVGKGKDLGFFIKAWTVLLVLGVASLIVGVVAVLHGQPYAVYYPLLLVGFLVTILSPFLIRVMRMAAQAAEMREMNARDAE